MSEFPAVRGDAPVGVRTLELTDPGRRGRTIPVELWYPASPAHQGADLQSESRDHFVIAPGLPEREQSAVRNATPAEGRFPLVLFSHGATSHRRSSTELTTHLASHGFVVASGDHIGNTLGDMVADLTAGTGTQPRRLVDVDQSASDRPQDAILILDAILGGVDPDIRAIVDPQRIGACGVSFGGWTTLALNELDPRPSASFPIVPAWGEGPLKTERLSQRVRLDNWKRPVPTFVLAAERDALILLPALRRLHEELPEPRRLAVLNNAGHVHFVDDARERHEELRNLWLNDAMPIDDPDLDFRAVGEAARPFDELCLAGHGGETVRALCLAHMKAHLCDDHEAAAWLAGDLAAEFAERQIDLEVI
jgi:predicted dienelactone hydrolase